MNAEELFFEPSASAQSLKSYWTRMASTYKCIEVRLSREQLIIRPRWFIGWMIKLLGLDLFHVVPTGHIQSVESTGKWFSYGKVLVKYRKNGTDHSILLYLKKYEEFLYKIRQVIERKANY
jgi:hypothetical protein